MSRRKCCCNCCGGCNCGGRVCYNYGGYGCGSGYGQCPGMFGGSGCGMSPLGGYYNNPLFLLILLSSLGNNCNRNCGF